MNGTITRIIERVCSADLDLRQCFVCLVTAGFFALEPSSSLAATRIVGSADELHAALAAAESGDVVVLKDGVYKGSFNVSRDGTTIRAQNRHAAILRGNGERNPQNLGLSVKALKVTIEDLRFEDHYIPIRTPRNTRRDDVTVRNNLIVNFYHHGLFISGDNWEVYNNVIGVSQQVGVGGRGISIFKGNRNKVSNNIIYAISGDNTQEEGSETGGCIRIAASTEGNLFQGNMCVASGDKSNIAIWTSQEGNGTNDLNVIQDNIFAWGEAGGFSPRSYRSSNNSFINNLCYEVESCASGKGNRPGRNQVLHNTVIVTKFSGPVAMEVGAVDDGERIEKNRIFKSNLMYSNVEHSGSHYNFLHAAFDAGGSYNSGDNSHNLYWAPWDENKWVKSHRGAFTYSPTDIHSRAEKKPIFVAEDRGDYTLAPDSPGAGKGHDGANIGIAWNEHLTLAKFQHLLALPTQEKPTNGGTNISFPNLHPGQEYIVEVFIPASNLPTGDVKYHVEGNKVERNLHNLFNKNLFFSGRAHSGANRYVSLGTHPVSDDGVLNVRWSHGNAAQRIFIRELPTPEQAYSWISPDSPPDRILDAFTQIESERFGEVSGEVKRVFQGTADEGIGHIGHAAWALYPQVDFGMGTPATKLEVRAASKNSGVIELHLDSPDGPLLASCPISGTGGWQSWQWFSTDISAEGRDQAQGVKKLFLVFKSSDDLLSNLMNVDAFKFTR